MTELKLHSPKQDTFEQSSVIRLWVICYGHLNLLIVGIHKNCIWIDFPNSDNFMPTRIEEKFYKLWVIENFSSLLKNCTQFPAQSCLYIVKKPGDFWVSQTSKCSKHLPSEAGNASIIDLKAVSNLGWSIARNYCQIFEASWQSSRGDSRCKFHEKAAWYS